MYQFKNWKLICQEKDREIARLKEELERVKKMERLTEKDGKWIGCKLPVEKKCPPYELCECEHFHKIRNKLAEYEDLEEQGLLLKLPCKVGDRVYRINKGARNPIIALVVTEIRYKALRSGKVAVKLICSDDVMTKTNGCLVYYLEEIGKKIWLTKAEAEKALAEMERK